MGNERVAVIGSSTLVDGLRGNLLRLGAAEVDAVGDDFWETLSLGRLQHYDCVLSVLSDPEALLRLNRMCLIAGVDMIAIELERNQLTVECFPFGSSEERACLECNLADEAYARIAERYASTGLRRAASAMTAAPASSTAPVAGQAAPAAAEAAFNLREEQRPPARRLVIDAVTGAKGVIRLERSGTCPGCEPFQLTPRIVRTRNRWSARVEGIPGDRHHVEQSLRLSDGLITRYECPSCGPLAEAAAYVNRRADQFDDTIAVCSRCHAPAVQVEIRNTFRLHELMERFGSAPVPVKYAVIDTADGPVCFDLEDGDA